MMPNHAAPRSIRRDGGKSRGSQLATWGVILLCACLFIVFHVTSLKDLKGSVSRRETVVEIKKVDTQEADNSEASFSFDNNEREVDAVEPVSSDELTDEVSTDHNSESSPPDRPEETNAMDASEASLPDNSAEIEQVEFEEATGADQAVQNSMSNVEEQSAESNPDPTSLSVLAESSNNSNSTPQQELQYPIFVASLYKSGTTSLHAYFQCGGLRSVHFKGTKGRTAPCFLSNLSKKRPMFEGCGDYDVFSDNAYILPPGRCWDPSVFAMDELYEHYPNATIVLAVRDSYSWIDSVDRFRFPKWALLDALMQCQNLWPTQKRDIGNRTLTKEDIRQFYVNQTQHVREFAQAHPSMNYIEIQLEDENAGDVLEARTGVPASCWGQKNVNVKHPTTTS